MELPKFVQASKKAIYNLDQSIRYPSISTIDKLCGVALTATMLGIATSVSAFGAYPHLPPETATSLSTLATILCTGGFGIAVANIMVPLKNAEKNSVAITIEEGTPHLVATKIHDPETDQIIMQVTQDDYNPISLSKEAVKSAAKAAMNVAKKNHMIPRIEVVDRSLQTTSPFELLGRGLGTLIKNGPLSLSD